MILGRSWPSSTHPVNSTTWQSKTFLPAPVWDTKEKAQQNLEFGESKMGLLHLPNAPVGSSRQQSRYVDPVDFASRANYAAIIVRESSPTILGQISLFHNLSSLTISNGILPTTFYQILVHLPRLTHLALESCKMGDLPSHYPHSFPSPATNGISITDISFRNVRRHGVPEIVPLSSFGPQLDLLRFLPNLCAITTEIDVPICPSVLQRLESLTCISYVCADLEDATIHGVNKYLIDATNLLHFSVVGLPVEPRQRGARAPFMP